jgi:hypothetical protein
MKRRIIRLAQLGSLMNNVSDLSDPTTLALLLLASLTGYAFYLGLSVCVFNQLPYRDLLV